jgi:hypothetical protein
MAATAASVAETELSVACTLERLAEVRPLEAERLRACALRARRLADEQRDRAAEYGFEWSDLS